jgi:hypothetical protein
MNEGQEAFNKGQEAFNKGQEAFDEGKEKISQGEQIVKEGMNQWRCDKCGATFTSQEEFDKHNRVHVEEEETTRAGAGGTGGRSETEGGRDLG